MASVTFAKQITGGTPVPHSLVSDHRTDYGAESSSFFFNSHSFPLSPASQEP